MFFIGGREHARRQLDQRRARVRDAVLAGAMNLLILVLLILLIAGAVPIFPYNQTWGPYPASALTVVLVVLVILLVLGRL